MNGEPKEIASTEIASIELAVKEHNELVRLKNELELMLDSKLIPVKIRLQEIEAQLLSYFNTHGITSLKTQYGTPYKATTRSVTIEDGESFFNFVASEGAFDLFQKRVNMSAYEEFINSGVVVPGVKVNSILKLKIKKS